MHELLAFLGALKTQLDRSEVAYHAYIDSGQTFLYAKILKKSNDGIRDLLLSKTHLLPPDLYGNAIALLHHIDVWSVLWEDTFLIRNPSITCVFSFANDVIFPATEVQRIIDYYNVLKR